MQPTHAKWEQINDFEVEANGSKAELEGQDDKAPSIFTPVKPIYSKNYMIVDTIYETAPASNLGIPGPDSEGYDLGFNGLASVPDDIKAELPPECLEAFEKALDKEMQWKNKWGTETKDSRRRQLIIDKGLVLVT